MAWNPRKTYEEVASGDAGNSAANAFKSSPVGKAYKEGESAWDKATGKNKKRNEQSKKDAEKAKAQKALDDARAARPEFGSITGKDGQLDDKFKYTAGQLGPAGQSTAGTSENTLNTEFLDQMRIDGLRGAGEDSIWRGLQQKKINRYAGDVQGNLEKSQASQLDTAAMRGGVGAGARERMGAQGTRDSLAAQQQAYGLGLDADIADEDRRAQALSTLGQAEMGAAGIDIQNQQYNIGNKLNSDQFNINSKFNTDSFNTNATNNQNQFNTTSLIGNTNNKNLFDMGLYTENMKAAGAQSTAAGLPGNKGKK